MLFSSKKKKRFFKKKKSNFHLLPFLAALAGIGFSLSLMFAGLLFVFFSLQAHNAALRDVQIETLIDRVSRHIVTNQFEQPLVATVQDPAALKQTNPNFYKYAQVGSRLLIWSDQAILYSIQHDLILGVLPLGAAASKQTDKSHAIAQEKEQATLEVRNGTFVPRLAQNFSDLLQKEGYQTMSPRDAAKKSYEKTLIINVSNQEYPETIKHLISLTGGELQDSLIAETNVKGDILIVLGNDYKP